MKAGKFLHKLFSEPYEYVKRKSLEALEKDPYLFFDEEEKRVNDKYVKFGRVVSAIVGPATVTYFLFTNASPISYTIPALLSVGGFCINTHFHCVKKRAKLAKALLSSQYNKEEVLKEIEKYSKIGRRAHLIGAASWISPFFLLSPLLSLLSSPIFGIWLTHLYKAYGVVYYTPLKYLKKSINEKDKE